MSNDATRPTSLRRCVAASRLLALFALSLPTLAIEIEVSAKGYPGRWTIDDLAPAIGDRSVDIEPGEHSFQLWNVDESYAAISVGADGDVSSSDPDRLARAGHGQLELVTFPIGVDAGGYAGRWWSGADTSAATTPYLGDETLRLAPATYSFSLNRVDDSTTDYTVTTSGLVATSAPDRLAASGTTLTLLTAPIDVYVRGYPGRWRSGADDLASALHESDQTVTLAAGTYAFGLHGVDDAYFRYRVTPVALLDARVDVLDPALATTTGDDLLLETRPIEFDVGDPAFLWRFGDTLPLLEGDQRLCLPAATYRFQAGGAEFDYAILDTGGAWTIAPAEQPIDGHLIRIDLGSGRCHNPDCDVLGPLVRVSVRDDLGQANGRSAFPAVNVDGTVVAFESAASNLVPGDTNGVRDVFVRDGTTGRTMRVNVSSLGDQADDGWLPGKAVASTGPAISDSGRFVVFRSPATNLVPGDTNRRADVFVHDRATRTTNRVSITSSGSEANGHSFASDISADGRFVAFTSSASNLVPGDTNGTDDTFVHDRITGTTTRVSVSGSGTQANALSYDPKLSADGRFVTFSSYASNLIPVDTNDAIDGFRHDRTTGTTIRFTVDSEERQVHPISPNRRTSRLSADGTLIVFSSTAPDLVSEDARRETNLFVRDVTRGETSRLPDSLDDDGFDFSADGRFVVSQRYFVADSGSVFVYDRVADELCAVDLSPAPGGTGRAFHTRISSDGSTLVFASDFSHLVPGDTNAVADIFSHGLRAHPAPSTPIPGELRVPGLTAGSLNPICGSLVDCGRMTTFAPPASIEAELDERFGNPQLFPPLEDLRELDGVSVLVRLDESEIRAESGPDFFEQGAWVLRLEPGGDQIPPPGDGGGAGLVFQGSVLTDFVELPFDVDGSGLLGDSQGEGVILFFAYTNDVVAQLVNDPQFDLVLENRSQLEKLSVSKPGRGLPPLPREPAKPDGPRAVGCARACELGEQQATSFAIGQARIRAAEFNGNFGTLISGHHVPDGVAVCDDPVSDVLIPDSFGDQVSEFSAVEFTDTCGGRLPRRVSILVYAGSTDVELIALGEGRIELGRESVPAGNAETVRFEHSAGIDRVELGGKDISVIEVCWNCEIEIDPVATGLCASADDAVEEDESIILGVARVLPPRLDDDSPIPLSVDDHDGDGEREVSIPYSLMEEASAVATIELGESCEFGLPTFVTLHVQADNLLVVAIDAAGNKIAESEASDVYEPESLSLEHAGGIARIELHGTQFLLDGICLDCPEPPEGPRFIRTDTNGDGQPDMSDAVLTLRWLFSGGPEPDCLASANANGDDGIDLSDPVFLLIHLFLGGDAPAPPFPSCGPGQPGVDEELGCEENPKACF